MRVRRHAHQLTQSPGRQLGVAVKCQHILRVGRHAGFIAQIQKRPDRALRQRRHQQFELAALALPTDPAGFSVTESAAPVQQDEARHRATRPDFRGGARILSVFGFQRVARVEFTDLLQRSGQQGSIGCRVRCVSIGPVGQQRKLRVALRVGKVMQLQAMHQITDGSGACQHAWNHHHHTVLKWNAVGQRQAGQVPGPRRFADQAVNDGYHSLRGWEHHQRPCQQAPTAGTGQAAGVMQQEPGHQAHGRQQ